MTFKGGLIAELQEEGTGLRHLAHIRDCHAVKLPLLWPSLKDEYTRYIEGEAARLLQLDQDTHKTSLEDRVTRAMPAENYAALKKFLRGKSYPT